MWPGVLVSPFPAHLSPAREPGRGTFPGVALLGQNTGTLVFLRVLPRDLRSRARSLCIPTWGVTKLTVVTAFFFFFILADLTGERCYLGEVAFRFRRRGLPSY